jgi:hypothetical protein
MSNLMYLVTQMQLDAINDYEIVGEGQCEDMTNWTCYVLPSLIPPVFTCALNPPSGLQDIETITWIIDT